jgi:hypothetical protein
VLHVGRKVTRGFLQPVHQRSYLRTARVGYQQPRDGECGFLEFLELSPQLLAVLILLLQGIVAVDEVAT